MRSAAQVNMYSPVDRSTKAWTYREEREPRRPPSPAARRPAEPPCVSSGAKRAGLKQSVITPVQRGTEHERAHTCNLLCV